MLQLVLKYDILNMKYDMSYAAVNSKLIENKQGRTLAADTSSSKAVHHMLSASAPFLSRLQISHPGMSNLSKTICF